MKEGEEMEGVGRLGDGGIEGVGERGSGSLRAP